MTTKISTDNIQAGALATLGSAVPKISSVAYVGDNTAADPAGGETVTVNGSGFAAGATVYIGGNVVGVVNVVSSTQITFTSPAKSAGSYTLYVVNTDGGTAIYVPGVSYSGVPTWSNAAGSLGTQYEYTSINQTFVATGDAPITYSLASGSLPTGSTLFGNGILSGTAPASAGSTTYSFTIRATDAQNQDTDRAFSLTINTDVVTWSSPADLTAYSVSQNLAIANVTLAASSAAGFGVTYAANTLPTGLSVSGNVITGTPTTVQTVSTLLTATANTTGKSATRTISWTVSLAVDANWAYNTLLLSGNSTLTTSSFVTDASTNNFQLTVAGDTRAQNFNPYTPGYYSVYLDGTGDYVDASTATTIGTGDFTAECWAWIPSTQVDAYTCFITSAVSSGGSIGIVMRKTMWWIGTGSSTPASINPSSYYVYNQWMHVAMTRSGSTVRAFVNGVLAGSMSSTDNIASTQFRFGCNYTDTTAYGLLTGYISNARIVAGTALYTAAFTPSTSPFTAVSGTQLLTLNSNRFVDTSGNDRTVTKVGDTTVNSFNPFAANVSHATYGSGYFDGTGDYLSIADSSSLEVLGSDFTLEGWIYITGGSSNADNVIVAKCSSAYAPYWVSYRGTAGQLAFCASSANTMWDVSNNTTFGAVTPNVWYHFAISRSGSNIRCYLNGVLGATVTWAGSLTDHSSPLTIGSQYNGANTFTGYISNIRLVVGTGIYTSAFTPPATLLTAIANTRLLTLQYRGAHNNSTFVDNSSLNNLITRNGNVSNGTFSPYGNNWSNYFDGTGDYISFPSSANYTLGTTGTDFTVECWIFPTAAFSASGAATYIMTSQSDYNSEYTNRWALVGKGNTILWFDATGNYAITSTTLTVLNVWSHIAVVRNGSTITMYVNGISVGSTSSTLAYTTQSGVLIGGIPNGNYFTGYISNARVIKGTARYTSAFTPGTTPLTAVTNTQLLTCQSNRLIDNSPNNVVITKNGDVAVQKFSPFSSVTMPAYYSGYFDGTGDYLSLASNAAFAFGNNNFTVEMWIYPQATPAANGAQLWDNRPASTNGAYLLLYIASNLTVNVWVNSANRITSSSISLNSWYHVAVVRNSGTTTLYLNGVSQGTWSDSTTYVQGATYIGASYAGSASITAFYTGYISNLRMVNGSAVYTTAFTPSTVPLTAVTNTQLLTCQSNTFIDNSTNNFAITVSGDSKPLPVSPFTPSASSSNDYSITIFSGSVYFDGTGDYLGITGLPTFGTGDFTIDGWVYNTGGTTNRGVFSLAGSVLSTSVGISLAYYSNGGGWQYSYAASSATTVATTLLVNTWYHFAFSRVSSTLKIFINGAQIASLSDTTNYTFSTLTIGGYYSTSQLLIGYVSDMRVIPGVGLYTSAFYPGTSPSSSTGIKPGTAINYVSTVLINGSNGIIDATRTLNFETVGDAKTTTSNSPYAEGGVSYYFDGTGDYLSTPSNPSLNFGTGSFTIELWAYFNSLTNSPMLFHKVTSNSGWFLEASASIIYFGYGLASSSQYWQASVTLTTGAWYHIAVTRVGAALSLFVNGTKQSNTLSGADSSVDNSTAAIIGSYSPNSSSFDLNGYIADFRITKGYARYTNSFTAPTTPYITR